MLLQSGAAYRCFCTAEQLQARASFTAGYDGACRHVPRDQSDELAASGHAYVVRLRRPDKDPEFSDLVYGRIKGTTRIQAVSEMATNDIILLKTSGMPTYHFANVIDDHYMNITHVIRGAEWLVSTPLHVSLYQAFDWTIPAFAHVGLLVDADGSKLSKRNLATNLRSNRQEGTLPEALVNFLALLGWRNPDGNDVMELHELVEKFDMKFTKGNTIVSTAKLHFMQKEHAARLIKRIGAHDSRAEALLDATVAGVQELFQPEEYELILQGRDLRSFVAAVMKADDLNYTYARPYLERNRYFFQYRPENIPAPRDSYGLMVSFEDVASLAEEIVARPLVPPTEDGNLSVQTSWNENDIAKALEHVCTTRARKDIVYADQRIFESDTDRDQASTSEARIVIETKRYRSALHRFLRDKLALGLPGPSSTKVMEILGREECERRLGIHPKDARQ
ncbi:Glutamate--tRNA ligase mitochondrial [Elasticomyces elasticus]|nr:Glutamate--tRNA ligase mitochondrial [Elasticomyces elasticus]